MKLYHGTSRKYLDKILEVGLKPRGKKGTNNWTHTVGSNPETVYLTNAYAIYFAHTASREDDMVVIEIDTAKLDIFNLVPDEDFLEQATRKMGPAPINKSMRYRTMWYRRRIKQFQHYWTDSLNCLGTCGHLGPMPVEAMTRFAIIPDKRRWELVLAGMDPFISLTNYRICGPEYRNWVRWAFDDPLVEEDAVFRNSTYMSKVDRRGIEVVTL